jgi:hypothetical protein
VCQRFSLATSVGHTHIDFSKSSAKPFNLFFFANSKVLSIYVNEKQKKFSTKVRMTDRPSSAASQMSKTAAQLQFIDLQTNALFFRQIFFWKMNGFFGYSILLTFISCFIFIVRSTNFCFSSSLALQASASNKCEVVIPIWKMSLLQRSFFHKVQLVH